MAAAEPILITGAGGMLGRALREALETRGFAPAAMDRSTLDVSDASAVARAFEQIRPRLVLNCAAHTKVDLCETEPDRCMAINADAVGHLADQCRRSGATLVHYSTDFVFDGELRRPYRVDDPTNPLSQYGRSKLAGEQRLLADPPQRWLLIRTAWVFGPGGASFPHAILNRARSGHPLQVVSDEVGCPTYTPDLAQATLDLLDASASGTWHVVNQGAVSRYDYARAILEEFGLASVAIEPVTTDQWRKLRPGQARRPAYSVLDTRPLDRLLGRPMRPWREALRDLRRREPG